MGQSEGQDPLRLHAVLLPLRQRREAGLPGDARDDRPVGQPGPYYEPAKWVARLRARKTDKNPLLFRTSTDAGHGGKSGRFESYRETAEEYAFILDQSGITQ